MPDAHRKDTEKEKLLKQAEIVCATLSIAGGRDIVSYPGVFDTVVVDEASQGVEISMLVPLRLGCRRLILVGDHKQLPSTCFSTVAKNHHYDRSLFERLQMSSYKVSLLQIQYRMHPAISQFPSDRFYDGLLTNARNVEEFEAMLPAPWSAAPCFKPVVFFNLGGSMTEHKVSFVNSDEADFVVQLFEAISTLWPIAQEAGEDRGHLQQAPKGWMEKIAVISPYAEQVQLIRQKFKEYFGRAGHRGRCPVDVNTVDGFQGREKDIIIVSCVRTHSGGNRKEQTIGFVKDKRRMNVAFTRARTNLFVVGQAKVLSINPDWKEFIGQQMKAGRYINMSKPFVSFLPRFLTGWFERHPEVPKPKPDSRFLNCHDAAQLEEIAPNGSAFELSPEELEALELEGEEDLRPDIEEVASEGASADEEMEGGEGPAQDGKEPRGDRNFAVEPVTTSRRIRGGKTSRHLAQDGPGALDMEVDARVAGDLDEEAAEPID